MYQECILVMESRNIDLDKFLMETSLSKILKKKKEERRGEERRGEERRGEERRRGEEEERRGEERRGGGEERRERRGEERGEERRGEERRGEERRGEERRGEERRGEERRGEERRGEGEERRGEERRGEERRGETSSCITSCFKFSLRILLQVDLKKGKSDWDFIHDPVLLKRAGFTGWVSAVSQTPAANEPELTVPGVCRDPVARGVAVPSPLLDASSDLPSCPFRNPSQLSKAGVLWKSDGWWLPKARSRVHHRTGRRGRCSAVEKHFQGHRG
ncbi:hypothetical protein DUI87_24898 [Hirundo rustica rustica]|uniref:Uncharacterized protein n=1 Tax=Hirundo rustica rustica TaxID=333673 RepID=A0A3M0JEB8_HIRRU|nr:hypothetical protein DUI87_24898 [Hirundo rustica rustica]